jgi:BMFP domain-containing protein YqiC
MGQQEDWLARIITRLATLSVEMEHDIEILRTPPTTEGDERAASARSRWHELVRSAYTAAINLRDSGEFTRSGRDRLTAMLALPADTREATIVAAVGIALSRLQKLELQVVSEPEVDVQARDIRARDGLNQHEARITRLEERLAALEVRIG